MNFLGAKLHQLSLGYRYGTIVLLCLLISIATGCTSSTGMDTQKLSVVTTTSIVGDWVEVVGGARVNVFNLVPRQTDPHAYRPGARDVETLANADAVFAVGLQLESGQVVALLENSVADGTPISEVTAYIEPLPFGFDAGEEHNDHGSDHAPGKLDPHFWFDPLRVKIVVQAIADVLSELEPSSRSLFNENAAAYVERLDELHGLIQAQVSQIPAPARVIVTSHDAFGYFGMRYGLEIVGVIFPGGGTEVEPSPLELTELVALVREHKPKVIFTEEALNDRLARALAQETGCVVGQWASYRLTGSGWRYRRDLPRDDAPQYPNLGRCVTLEAHRIVCLTRREQLRKCI